MNIVINRCFGGFSLPDKFCQDNNMNEYDDIERTDSRLIEFLLDNKGNKIKYNGIANLVVYEIPDDATDYRILEYDGLEYIIYAHQGKLYYAKESSDYDNQ